MTWAMPGDDKANWTFVVDFEGGTYVGQYADCTMKSAVARYNRDDPSGLGLVPLAFEADDHPAPLTGVASVWNTDGFSRGEDKFFTVLIVKTEI